MMTHNLGFLRIGAQRELKLALENYWAGRNTEAQLLAVAKKTRQENWQRHMAAGIDLIPSSDFSLYNQVLDLCAFAGAVPERFLPTGGDVDLATQMHFGTRGFI